MYVGAESFAEADARTNRKPRDDDDFFDESCGDFGFCDLCRAGPFAFRGQRIQHQRGGKHRQKFLRYCTLYREFATRFENEKALVEKGKRAWKLEYVVQPFHDSPFWCGDLSLLKEALYDVSMTLLMGSAYPTAMHSCGMSLNMAFQTHCRRVQADLMLLAYVKVFLDAQFGSVDEYRDHCTLQDSHGLRCTSGSSCSWKLGLRAACGEGSLFLDLVMPWVTLVPTPPLHPDFREIA